MLNFERRSELPASRSSSGSRHEGAAPTPDPRGESGPFEGTNPPDVEVWLSSVHLSREMFARFETSLSPDERARAARFRHAADRQRFVAGRGLARVLLGAELHMEPAQVPIEVNDAGRPVVKRSADAARVNFSVSHSGEWVLVATSRAHLVGVDVEMVRSEADLRSLADTAFAPAERSGLAEVPDADLPAAFHAIWTRREALTKAMGRGLRMSPELVEVSAGLNGEPRVRRVPPEYGSASEWALHDLRLPDGYAGALAVYPRAVRVSAWQLG